MFFIVGVALLIGGFSLIKYLNKIDYMISSLALYYPDMYSGLRYFYPFMMCLYIFMLIFGVACITAGIFGNKKCRYCKSVINREYTFCPHCGEEQ